MSTLLKGAWNECSRSPEKFMDICDEKATVLSRSMMIKVKNTPWMRLVYHVVSEICFQLLHPVRPWINRVAIDFVFHPPALVARATWRFVVLSHLCWLPWSRLPKKRCHTMKSSLRWRTVVDKVSTVPSGKNRKCEPRSRSENCGSRVAGCL